MSVAFRVHLVLAFADNSGSVMCRRGSAVLSDQGKGAKSSLRANKMLLTGADSTLPGIEGESLKNAITSEPKPHCMRVLNLLMLQVYLMQAPLQAV